MISTGKFLSRFCFVVLILLGLTQLGFSKTSLYQSRLYSLIPEEAIGNDKLGVFVGSLRSEKAIFKYNDNKLFIPASNNKVVSSYAAMSLLGKDFRFKTEFYSGGEINNGTLFGELYIKAYGDPTINTNHLLRIIRHFKQRGIKKIKGDIVLDNYFFDTVEYAKGWKSEWVGEYYCPPVDAFSLNYNTIDIFVAPSSLGSKSIINIYPESYNISVENKLITTRKRKSINAKIDPENNILVVKGGVYYKSGEQKLSISTNRPVTYFGIVFGNLLLQEGIEFEGRLIRKEVPNWASLFYTHYSEPLYVIVNEFNKESVNIIGEALVKSIGAKYLGAPGTWEKGASVISNFLIKQGVGSDIEYIDGSGLSLQNKITPKALAGILSKAYRDSNFSYEFLSSLPLSGVDGTLKKRFKDPKLKGKIAAKTGYLKGVRALSGYVFGRNGNILVFSIISNGLGWKAKNFQDKLLAELVDCCSS